MAYSMSRHGGHDSQDAHAADAAHDVSMHAHPSDGDYIRIAIILAAITVTEVAVYYIQWIHDIGLLVPILVVLSVIKFGTVVGFFMHLKFDDRRLLYMFVSALVLAVSIVGALATLFRFHGIDIAKSFLS